MSADACTEMTCPHHGQENRRKAAQKVGAKPHCGCWSCVTAMADLERPYGSMFVGMIVCPECGNKRCPRATLHANACTGSNDPMQPGSRYGGTP